MNEEMRQLRQKYIELKTKANMEQCVFKKFKLRCVAAKLRLRYRNWLIDTVDDYRLALNDSKISDIVERELKICG